MFYVAKKKYYYFHKTHPKFNFFPFTLETEKSKNQSGAWLLGEYESMF